MAVVPTAEPVVDWRTAALIDSLVDWAKAVPPRNVTAPKEKPVVPVRYMNREQKRRVRRRR